MIIEVINFFRGQDIQRADRYSRLIETSKCRQQTFSSTRMMDGNVEIY